MSTRPNGPAPAHAALVGALTPDVWERANRELVAKLITELTYEELLAPTRTGEDTYVLHLGALTIPFRATPRALGGFTVDPASLGDTPALDAATVVALGAPALGADPSTTAGLVDEVTRTLVADAVGLSRGRPVEAILDEPPHELERELRGHPWIVASKGRLGFDAGDLLAYTPEAREAVDVQWLHVDPELCRTAGRDHAEVARDQTGEDGFAELTARAPDRPGVLVPVHPWQWTNRVLTTHAGDIAAGRITPLGSLGQHYVAGQSIRTLVHADHPGRRSIKLALSILNTSTYRGIPPARALAAPALSAWLAGHVHSDAFLRESGLVLLEEVAAVSVPQHAYELVEDVPYQHTEQLGAIYRDSVHTHLLPGERAIPLAALIHRDPAGRAFATALIRRSGADAETWVGRLHDVTLPPLLHVLYRYGTAFSPHGQNCLVVLGPDGLPARLVVRDFVDDLQICADVADPPAVVQQALGDGIEASVLAQWIQCGLLVCVHRYLADILRDDLGFPESTFWMLAERSVAAYQARFEDELGDRFALFDLEAPAFVKLCLNRVRILGRGYADAPDRPIASASGLVRNPLAAGVGTA